jgi:hypothetical protein
MSKCLECKEDKDVNGGALIIRECPTPKEPEQNDTHINQQLPQQFQGPTPPPSKQSQPSQSSKRKFGNCVPN